MKLTYGPLYLDYCNWFINHVVIDRNGELIVPTFYVEFGKNKL